jgi:hypothetical protein
MLDQTARWANDRKLIQGRVKPLALDSSMFESRHVSRHFEKRQQQSERDKRRKREKIAEKRASNLRRSRVVRRLPKLSLAVASSCHLILAARATTGGGADQPFFKPLLQDARRRAPVGVAVADAGYDSEDNHIIARQEMGIRSIIPPNTGRPSKKPPPARHRRNMYYRFKRRLGIAGKGGVEFCTNTTVTCISLMTFAFSMFNGW